MVLSTGADAAVRVTIAHDFAEAYGGAERILATIASIYPEAGVHAILGRRAVAERMGIAERFHSELPERSALLRHYRLLAPLYPGLVRARRLPDADVLLSSSYAFATAFRTRNDAPQLCYCYSPLRFAWSMTDDYGEQLGTAAGLAMRPLAAALRRADRRAARRVTRFIAESDFIAEQIRRFYDRDSVVIRPPVDTNLFAPGKPGHDGYYLFCGRLVEAYKRPSLAVEAFRRLGKRLVVAGDGPALAELRAGAPDNIDFRGHLDDDELIPLMQRCAALVFPSRDDFGLMPVEVMACGRPAIAFAGGGALETVAPGLSGEFFQRQDADSLEAAVASFDPDAYDPAAIREHAEQFGAERFREAIRRQVQLTREGVRL